jgi:hypothetical protein
MTGIFRSRAVVTSIRTQSAASSMRREPEAPACSQSRPMTARRTSLRSRFSRMAGPKSVPGAMVSTSMKTRSGPNSSSSRSWSEKAKPPASDRR